MAKIFILLTSLVKRFFDLFKVFDADFVFLHREMLPVGPPVLEWFVARILRKKIIFDFDDAIWLTDKSEESLVQQIIRWRSKVSSICKWSDKISCGNEYLRQYAIQLNERAVLNPTTIDTDNLHNPSRYKIQKDQSKVIIGWSGSHSTLKYFYLLETVLQQIQGQYPFVDVTVIANKEPLIDLKRINFVKWSLESEIEDLMTFDIGIMPLPDDEWSKGKCGFKALQYMALEIPAVASPVGVNCTFIEHGVNGYLCSSNEEWILVLQKLILDTENRKKIGEAGRQTVIQQYSVSSNVDNFLSLFQ
jgi:glycosyltransferase involved in cell wall biosynthesis